MCDGTQASVISSRTCTIPDYHFTLPPFDLPWGSSISAKVVATNYRGSSPESTVGNGAVILTVPAAPTNLRNDPSVTMGDRIGLLWDVSSFESGSSVIDFRVMYDQGTQDFVTVESAVTLTSFTVTSLTAGTTY